MPKDEKMVDLDTSGEGAEINLEEQSKMKLLLKIINPKEAESGEQLDVQEDTKQEEVPKKSQKKKTKNLKITAKVFKLELQNLHVKCVKLKGKEMQLLNMQKQLKKNVK